MYIEALLHELTCIWKCRTDWCMHNRAFLFTCTAGYGGEKQGQVIMLNTC